MGNWRQIAGQGFFPEQDHAIVVLPDDSGPGSTSKPIRSFEIYLDGKQVRNTRTLADAKAYVTERRQVLRWEKIKREDLPVLNTVKHGETQMFSGPPHYWVGHES